MRSLNKYKINTKKPKYKGYQPVSWATNPPEDRGGHYVFHPDALWGRLTRQRFVPKYRDNFEALEKKYSPNHKLFDFLK